MAISSLKLLLRDMSPQLDAGRYVYVTLAGASYGDYAQLQPLSMHREEEGLSLLIPLERAQEQGLSYGFVGRLITLQIHSSLEAVGLTAAVSSVLAAAGISANVIAAYYHDHILVPESAADEAILCLQTLSESLPFSEKIPDE